MVNPLVASSLISTGGSLVGGLFGKKSKRPLRPDELRAEKHKDDAYLTKGLINIGKQNGIHPLTMLGGGIPQVSGPVYNGGSQPSAGQNIAKAVTKGASEYFTGKANEEMNKLALERAGLENELLRTQITSINNPDKAGTAYSNDQRVLRVNESIDPKKVEIVKDENVTRSSKDRGLTAGSDSPPPAGKKFTVGSTPYGEVYITLPPSGQADEYGELYGAIKGIEYLAKRGYVHYTKGVAKASKSLARYIRGQKSKPSSRSVPSKGYSKIKW